MKKILFFALSALMFAGCGKFLEEKSQSEVIPKTTADFSELLLGSGYPAPDGDPKFNETYLLDDDVSLFFAYGEGEPGHYETRIGTQDAIDNAFYYTWQPLMMDYNGYGNEVNQAAGSTTYGSFYEKIKGCNAVLDLLDGSIGTQEEKDRVKGEALALRAFYYFWLTNLYGKPYNYDGGESLAVPVKLTADLSDDILPRATVGYIYEEIIVPDLTEAARLLESASVTPKKNYRINPPTVHILLSRVYLYMDRYEDCVAEVDKAMKYGLTLMDYTDVTAMQVYNSSNIIRYENPEVLWMYGSGAAKNISSYVPGQGSDLVAMLKADTKDTRYLLFGFTPSTNANDHKSVTITKPVGTFGAADMAVRASEAWLNIAEAYALWGGHDTEALRYYNEIRDKRVTDHATESLTGAALLDAIRLERRKELCYEGHRWFDLRRQGMPEIRHMYKAAKGGPKMVFILEAGDEMYTLPFPTSVIENNSNTEVNMEQNPSRYIPQRSFEYEEVNP